MSTQPAGSAPVVEEAPAATGPAVADSRRSPMGAVFSAVAVIEAITWAGLLVGMFLKYVTETTEFGVFLFGRLHGAAFMIYLVVAIVAAIVLRWRWWVAVLAILAAVPPLVTVVLEIWLHRTGRLSRRSRATRAAGAEAADPAPAG